MITSPYHNEDFCSLDIIMKVQAPFVLAMLNSRLKFTIDQPVFHCVLTEGPGVYCTVPGSTDQRLPAGTPSLDTATPETVLQWPKAQHEQP